MAGWLQQDKNNWIMLEMTLNLCNISPTIKKQMEHMTKAIVLTGITTTGTPIWVIMSAL
jgi:hypothetical protein